ncbi:MAG: nucleotidyl transferase AbiEii/AbiGii toxin family protein [Chloroflexota bacterium]
MITQGQLRLISRHYAGHGEPYAFLELAQEHFLLWMMREGLFDIGPEDVVFKGGTAIRKYRLGLRGRFSTDLDFAIADGAYADHIITSLDQGLIDLEGVRFRATSIDVPAAKAQWIAVVDGLGETMEAKIEFTRRPTLLPPTMPETRPEIPGFSPQLIGFDLPLVPLMRLEENLSEKLARFRRIIRSRDLYDLAALGREVRDALPLIRLSACFKVYFDVVRDGRVSPAPFLAGPEFMNRTTDEIFDPDDLGLIMGGRVDYASMLGTIASMFGPMGTPQGELEERLAQLSPKDLWWAEQQYEELRTVYRSLSPEPAPVV